MGNRGVQLWTFLLLLDLLRDLLVRTSVMLLKSPPTDLSASELSCNALPAEVAVWNVRTACVIPHRMLTPCTAWRVSKGVDVFLSYIQSLGLASTISRVQNRRLGNHLLPKSLVDLGVVDVLRRNVHGMRYVGVELEPARKPHYGCGLPDAVLRVVR